MTSRPLLVVIGYVWPEPNSSAAGSRMLNLIDFFRAHDWQIIFASAATVSEHRFDLPSIGVSEQPILLNDSSFDDWIKIQNPTAVLFDRFFTEEQFGWRVQINCPSALRLLDTEDFHGLRKIRHLLLKQTASQIHDGLAKGESTALGVVQVSESELFESMIEDESVQRELAAIYRCDLTVMVSQFEINFLTQYFSLPNSILFYLPLLVEPLAESKILPDYSERKDFIVIGNFRHEPNWDSVQLLKNWIWPVLRKKLNAAGISCNLKVCGAYPPPKATELHKPSEGFCVKGWVEDAQAEMSSVRVCLAPLRFGAGQKGKLFLAMQMGTPSVTTSIGAEAMMESPTQSAEAPQSWCGAIEDDLNAFVDAAFNLYTSESHWREAQQKGYSLLSEQKSADVYGEIFWSRLSHIQNNLEKHRHRNVVGVLLQQQQFRASQYMGQWIEEKNKKK